MSTFKELIQALHKENEAKKINHIFDIESDYSDGSFEHDYDDDDADCFCD